MKKIKLTQGKFALVDNEDYKQLNQWEWYAHTTPRSKTHYAVRSAGKGSDRIKIFMAREIMKAQDNQRVEFLNGNGLDVQKANLKLSAKQKNGHLKKGDKIRAFQKKGEIGHEHRDSPLKVVEDKLCYVETSSCNLSKYSWRMELVK